MINNRFLVSRYRMFLLGSAIWSQMDFWLGLLSQT